MIDADMEFNEDLVCRHANEHDGGNTVLIGRVIYEKSLPQRGYAHYIETRGAMKLKVGEIVPGRYFLSGHVSLLRKLFYLAGGFDESFTEHGGEDLDLGMRLEAGGAIFKFNPELLMSHLHIREIYKVTKSEFEYGRYCIPLLLNKHPILHNQLRLGWIAGKGLESLLKKMILSAPIFTIIRAIAKVLSEFHLPAIVYDYLIFRSYYMGFQKHKTSL